MYVYLHILSFKFETKIKIEGRTDGEENAEAGKRRPEKQHKLFQFHIRVTKNSLLLPDLFALPSYLSE